MVRFGIEIVDSRTRPSRSRWRGAILVVVAFLTAGSLTANDRPVSEILGLTPDALSRFVDLQDTWLEWLSAVAQGDGARVSELLNTLLADAEVLGLRRLPDLSLGAAGRAVAFAEDERFDAAAQCLAAAEKLDPGRSEVAFAGARVAQLEGDYGAEVGRVAGEAIVGAWRGPASSVYGLHFIRVTNKEPAYLPVLDVIVAEVRADWLREVRDELRKERMDALRDAYTVHIERVP